MEEKNELKPKKNSQNIIIVGLIIIIILLIAVISILLLKDDKKDKNNNKSGENTIEEKSENNKNENPSPVVEDVNDFKYSDGYGYGIATVEGYVTIESVSASELDYPGAPRYNLVYFNITDSKNEEFLKYLREHEGNTYVGENKFAIGCYEDDKITYINDSDATGMKNYELTKEDTNMIMNSKENNPVKLEIEIYKFTGGSGAPQCYSFISRVEVK